MDHASFLLKRRDEAESDVGAEDDCGVKRLSFVRGIARVRDAERSSDCLVSSHWVSHFPAMKSGCEIMAWTMEILVLMPMMRVSSSALFAFRSTACQLGAVMINFAMRLSKSAVTEAGEPPSNDVSTRIPFPVGK